MSESVTDQRQRLFVLYHECAPTQRAVVNLLAVAWGGLNKTQITTALRKILDVNELANIRLDMLQSDGLIEADRITWTSQRVRCNRSVVEWVARELVASGQYDRYVDRVRLVEPLQKSFRAGTEDDFLFRSDDELIREVRIGLYQGDEAYIERLFEMLVRQQNAYWNGLPERWLEPAPIYAMVCGNPFDRAWFERLSPGIKAQALPILLLQQLADWELDAAAYALLCEMCETPEATNDLLLCRALITLFRGELEIAENVLSRCAIGSRERAYRGLLMLIAGDANQSLQYFRDGLALLRKEVDKRKTFFPGVVGIFFILALLQRKQTGDMEEAQKLFEAIPANHPYYATFSVLKLVPQLECNELPAFESLSQCLRDWTELHRRDLWCYWIALWLSQQYRPDKSLIGYASQAEALQHRATGNGYRWLAAELAALLARIDPQRHAMKGVADAFIHGTGIRLLLHRSHFEEPWERALNAIQHAVLPDSQSKLNDSNNVDEYRLAWLLSRERESYLGFALEPREQKRNANGTWNKGKPLSLKKVFETAPTAQYFSAQDRRVAAHIVPERYSGKFILTERGWLEMAGLSTVFWKNNGVAVELVAVEPELRIGKRADGQHVKIEFWPLCDEEEKIVLAEDGLTRIKVIELKPEHHHLARIVGKGIEAPMAAQERILSSLSAVSSLVTIHSDIGGAQLTAAETVPADVQPLVQLIPEGDGLRVAMLVRPFGNQGSYYTPGSGGTNLITEIAGRRLQTQRDLLLERRLASEVIERCRALDSRAQTVTPYVWLLEEVESSLLFLLELREAAEAVRVEWPQGEKFKLLGQASLSQFSIKIKQQRDWFSVSGEFKLDDGLVVSMQQLLELTEGVKSQFIQLDENRFIALTEAFKKRLDDLRTFAEKHGKDYRLHASAIPVMDEIAAEVGDFHGDAAWQQQLQRLRQAEQVQPKLPSTLQAELRDYQYDGFAWLYRLSEWGVGACLADDMGLGKTLQALAIILCRASAGPTLVVAPTSVCMNWHSEVQRFAPTLRVEILGSVDRQERIASLQPMDLLICSYALLQQGPVGQLLSEVTWQTVVLDEAQMIKNPATKRSRQAMALRCAFKMITTGTPVENHLGELWNLFRFINPGLLGSLESFNRRFAIPIERNQDRDARQRLKRMIQPFIMRRTKAQVLDELPPRTEIELQVELSEQETAFYEALRRKLLNELQRPQAPVEDQRFKVLAAITKLRRACCNTQLVAPDLGLSSSKLALFGEVLQELLENRHKTLVFSQFVDHLGLIRHFLDEKNVAYQYLDGQTPAAERKKRVDAFQAGEGEVFLISLKAGGVGLNLTAADYVIHMDPWWNPAVEDQASDRAHRIGQQRPVTVYRLITKNTIEEQMVSLHRHKRDLADSVLEGGEISGKISAEELLDLIRSG